MMVVTKNEFLLDKHLLNVPNLELIPNADLTSKTTMATRSHAALMAIPHTPRALRDLLVLVRDREYPLMMLAGGSNTIFATQQFDGIVCTLPKNLFGQMHVISHNMVRVGAAASLGGLLNFVRKNGMMGLEFCTMIPGLVGGALAGNAGAGNWGICDFVERAVVMTRSGRVVEVNRGDFRFSYRYSELSEAVVLEADLLLEPLDEGLSRQRCEEFRAKKKGQPYKIPSSGCIFKNPKDPHTGRAISAGMLIDQAGLKGYRLNDVLVSEGHANFIVNQGRATGEDFLAMISLIQDVVYERHGILLDVEARIVGGPLTSCILR